MLRLLSLTHSGLQNQDYKKIIHLSQINKLEISICLLQLRDLQLSLLWCCHTEPPWDEPEPGI